MEQGKISARQLFYMLVVLVSATAIMFMPAVTAQIAGRDAWLAPILVTAPGLYLVLVLVALGKRFPGRTIIQYLETTFGAWVGKTVGILYLFFFLHTNDLVIREFSELMVNSVLPRTPLTVFHVLILLLCAWAVRSGLEVLARTIELTIPQVILVFFLLFILAFKEMHFANLTPVLANGLMPVVKASLAPEAWLGEVILLAMLLPYLARPEEGKRSALWAVVFLSFLLSVSSVTSTAVLGSFSARLTLPTYEVVRSISMGFLQRLDSLMVAMWIAGLFAKIALFYYAFVLGAAQLAGLKDYRPLVLPAGALLAVLSVHTVDNSVELVDHITHVWPYFGMIFEYFLPTAVLAVAALRGLKDKGSDGEMTGTATAPRRQE